ncbi:hypothetical protein BpHYR1_015832 [Brachionus plicatilis]|uniref:Uncharacterized protein n=1 Tax=Brachionus plicatilis TaxID=10195 RepID=A0A3M7SNZ8_BRAPC|nr:hypothetical protein BpHYR1_015832 [Brachionus plicatilis]
MLFSINRLGSQGNKIMCYVLMIHGFSLWENTIFVFFSSSKSSDGNKNEKNCTQKIKLFKKKLVAHLMKLDIGNQFQERLAVRVIHRNIGVKTYLIKFENSQNFINVEDTRHRKVIKH